AAKPDMGLQTWDEEREYPLQEDALNSKNYLGPLQLEDLNRLVVMVLDFFEDQVKRGWLVTMADAEQRLKEILDLNKRKLLKGYGSIKTEDAEAHAKAEYKKFDKERKAARKAKALEELNARARSIGTTSRGKPKKASGA
ncbi:MAG TPA: RhuM family protein, partial [Hyphomicrobium sp.]|uniref:RhuM family protein n=1 Tax=Hyphomicrobium sp. TaxID=82 RepID=UPI002C0988A2